MSVTCTKCHNQPSVYYRPYSGERLCSTCFKNSLVEKTRKTISKFDMFEYDSRIAVGVSGGKDSLTLLHLLDIIEEKRPNAELIAICVDEGIDGYRDEALHLAEKNCKKLGVEMFKTSFHDLFDVTIDKIALDERELSICSYCGVFRRRALNDAAKMVDADRLATGHNLDDMAQTVLMNVLRGDIDRIHSFYPGGEQLGDYVRRVKPICEIPERETALYAYLNGIEFQSIPCPYYAESMRTDIRHFINRMEYKHSGTLFITYQTGLKLRQKKTRSTITNTCFKCGAPTPNKLCKVCQLLS